ncbi:MAG TPA: hypothetical protein VF811_14185 [Parasulfuritortus sp.]
MKLTRTAFVLAALPAFVYSAGASAGMSDIVAADNQVGIQVTDMNLDYTETGDGVHTAVAGTLDTEKGDVYGFNLTYSSLANWFLGNDYLALQYGQNHGNTDYVGQPLTSTVNTYGSKVQTDTAKTIDYSLRYGKGFVLGGKAMAIPYLEVGSHEWDRGLGSYDETYKHSYYGVGAMLQFSPANKLVLTLDGLVGRTHGAHLDAANGLLYSGDLGSDSLTRFGVSADYAFTKRIHGMVGFDYTDYKYGVSQPNWLGLLEPDSETKKTMYRVGIGYAF